MKTFLAFILFVALSISSCSSNTFRIEKDKETGIEVVYLTNDKYQNTIAYPTCKTWSADGKWVFIESTRPRPDGTKIPKERQIIKVNVETGQTDHLATLEVEDWNKYGQAQFGVSLQYHFDYAQEANVLVYYDVFGHNMYLLDVATGKSNKILHEPEGTIGDPPSITPDGTRVVYYVYFRSIKNRFFGDFITAIFYIDVDPKTLEAVGKPKLVTAYPSRIYSENQHGISENGSVVINHCQVNPKDKNHYCYSHQYMNIMPDGSADLSRCWENVGGIDRPVIVCEPRQWQTHEVIGPLGKKLYIVERFNIVSVDFESRKKHLIYENKEGYKPNHISISPDEKWISADIFESNQEDENGCYPSGILLIEAKTGKAKVVCRTPRGRSHPAHPHPNFSPDGKKIAFVVADSKDTCQVAVVDITEMISKWNQ